MKTKRIAIDREAYNKLVDMRYTPNESFSSVIKRLFSKPVRGTAEGFRLRTKDCAVLSEENFKQWDML